MTKLMEEAIDTLRSVPPDMQDEMALIIMQLTGKETTVYELTAEEESDIRASQAEAARGEFAANEQMLTIWTKYGQ